MNTENLAAEERLSNHVLNLQLADIPQDTVETAISLIRDTLAVGISGAGVPLADKVLQMARQWGETPENSGAYILGRDIALPPASAAFVNGFQIHCQEFDCVHETAVVHPMATIMAALLSAIQHESRIGKTVTGADFLAATIGAVDVAAGLGLAVASPLKFFRPATAGLFGATLGVARIRGFSTAQAMNALGLALAHCSGSMQAHVEGKVTLPLQIGNAARAAIVACEMTLAGLEGPLASITGPYGYLPLFEDDWDLDPILNSLGHDWRVDEVSFKVYPTGRAAQGGLLGIQQLRASPINIAQINKITLSAPPIMKRLVGRPWHDKMPTSYARLCFAYLGARALQNGEIGLADFSPEKLSDPSIEALASKIFVTENHIEDPAAFTPQQLIVDLADGSQQIFDIPELPGSPGGEFDRSKQLDKAEKCFEFGFGTGTTKNRLNALIHITDRLADQANLEELSNTVFLNVRNK